MALIGKIRQNMWFVFALLGVALLAFMMMDSSGPGGGASTSSTAFTVNGKKIDVQELQRVESLESNGSGLTGNALRSKVYNDMVTNAVVGEEAEDLGIRVSEDEMDALLFGNRMSPVIQQMFRNPRTGQIDFQQLQQFKNEIDTEKYDGYRPTWNAKKKQVVQAEIQNKISNMVTKGMYTPTWLADEMSKSNGINANIDYVKIPFGTIADANVNLTDADYTAYLNDNKGTYYQKEAGRVLEYVTFNVVPTNADSLALRTELAEKIADFATTKTDSLFAISNRGNYVDFYFKADDLPESLQSTVKNMEVGTVAGPLRNERFYTGIKLIDKKVVADSAYLRHIYRPIAQGDVVGQANAVKYMDSLKNLIETGVAQFDSLAIKYSQDPSSASKGGDLGAITQGQFLPAINKLAFFTGTPKKLYTVVSANGVHLIDLKKRVFDNEDAKYKVAFINAAIEPSPETIAQVTDQATSFITDNRSLEAMRASADKMPNVQLKTTKVLKAGDYEFENYSFNDDARDIVLWAFNDDTEVGDVSSNLFTFQDKTFNYESSFVIPALQAKTTKGMPRLSDIKGSITDQVRSFVKGKQLAANANGKSFADAKALNGALSGTIPSVSTANAFVGDLGYEPKVMAAIIATPEGQTSQPIRGMNGVYVVKVNSKNVNMSGGNFAKQAENAKIRRNVPGQLFNALKNSADIEDNRMTFSL